MDDPGGLNKKLNNSLAGLTGLGAPMSSMKAQPKPPHAPPSHHSKPSAPQPAPSPAPPVYIPPASKAPPSQPSRPSPPPPQPAKSGGGIDLNSVLSQQLDGLAYGKIHAHKAMNKAATPANPPPPAPAPQPAPRAPSPPKRAPKAEERTVPVVRDSAPKDPFASIGRDAAKPSPAPTQDAFPSFPVSGPPPPLDTNPLDDFGFGAPPSVPLSSASTGPAATFDEFLGAPTPSSSRAPPPSSMGFEDDFFGPASSSAPPPAAAANPLDDFGFGAPAPPPPAAPKPAPTRPAPPQPRVQPQRSTASADPFAEDSLDSPSLPPVQQPRQIQREESPAEGHRPSRPAPPPPRPTEDELYLNHLRMQSELRRSQGGGGLFGKFLGKVAKAVLGDEGPPSGSGLGGGGGSGSFGGPRRPSGYSSVSPPDSRPDYSEGGFGGGEWREPDEGHRTMARQLHAMDWTMREVFLEKLKDSDRQLVEMCIEELEVLEQAKRSAGVNAQTNNGPPISRISPKTATHVASFPTSSPSTAPVAPSPTPAAPQQQPKPQQAAATAATAASSNLAAAAAKASVKAQSLSPPPPPGPAKPTVVEVDLLGGDDLKHDLTPKPSARPSASGTAAAAAKSSTNSSTRPSAAQSSAAAAFKGPMVDLNAAFKSSNGNASSRPQSVARGAAGTQADAGWDNVGLRPGERGVVREDPSELQRDRATMEALKDEDDPNEPPERREARRRRLAEKQAQMEQAKRDKQDADRREEQEKAKKAELKAKMKDNMEAWRKKNKDNIRAMLGSLHEVLWPKALAGWKRLTLADLVDESHIKKSYHKALLLVHPDKVRNGGGSLEEVAQAEMIFDALKEAFGRM